MQAPPSGKQFHISSDGYCAVIVEIGAGIRRLDLNDRPVLESYREDAICDGAHGAHLVPWPNRVLGGTYQFMGQSYQLPLTEPTAGNAIHGLLRWTPFTVQALTHQSVTLSATLHPTPWYPFALEVCFRHELSASGLTVTSKIINRGLEACPLALGHHPYLSPGTDETIDTAMFSTSAIPFDSAEEAAFPGSPLTEPVLLRHRIVDATFVAQPSAQSNTSWVRLTGADGRTVALWADASYRYLQFFTGDSLAEGRRRRAIAAEPMTAPPNALQSGQDLLVLRPNESIETQWGVQLQ